MVVTQSLEAVLAVALQKPQTELSVVWLGLKYQINLKGLPFN